MSLEHGRERLKQAVGILADEKDRVKERLLVAYASQLSRINREEDLPEHLKEVFAGLRYAISDVNMPYGFSKHASEKIMAMSEEEASLHAQRIFSMFLNAHDLETESTGAALEEQAGSSVAHPR